MTPSVGRIVHFRIGGTDPDPTLRPATIVRVWGGTIVNLVVQLDGENDTPDCKEASFAFYRAGALTMWATSASEGEAVGQWRWPARS